MITVATYNILHDYYYDLISKNINFLISQGADVICLQEADPQFAGVPNNPFLNPALADWKIQYFHSGIACNLAIAWNTKRVSLESVQTILLPVLSQPSVLQRMKHLKEPLQRGALSALFKIHGKTVRITNTHLAWEGGLRHRLRQLVYLRDTLDKSPAESECLAGDFNTSIPSLFRKYEQTKVENVLGKNWTDELPNLVWSDDDSFTAPQDGWDSVIKILRFFHIKFRMRLDYIFATTLNSSPPKCTTSPAPTTGHY